jgi:hypothetical protein
MYYVGLDIGKAQDHTAIVIVRRADRLRAWMEPEFEGLGLCFAERVALGTAYPLVAGRVREIVTDEKLRGQVAVAVDATGVGAPIVDMLRAGRLGCEVAAVTITGGEKASGAGPGNAWSVPKQDLMAGVQVLLERRQLKIAPTLKEAGALVRELTDVKMTAGARGRLRMGADGSGEHDDLVVALGLAVWRAMRPMNGFGVRRLPGI